MFSTTTSHGRLKVTCCLEMCATLLRICVLTAGGPQRDTRSTRGRSVCVCVQMCVCRCGCECAGVWVCDEKAEETHNLSAVQVTLGTQWFFVER